MYKKIKYKKLIGTIFECVSAAKAMPYMDYCLTSQFEKHINKTKNKNPIFARHET